MALTRAREGARDTMAWVAVAAAATSGLILLAVALGPDPGVDPTTPTAPAPSASAGARPEVAAAAVLAGWDAERAAAWAAGDVRRLRRLYVDGSAVGERDVALLKRWIERGARVEGMRTQVLGLRAREVRPGRLVLSVTDRLVGATARLEDRAVTLPTQRASTHRVVLVLRGSRWRVARVSEPR